MDLERHSTRWSGVSLALVLLRTTVLESLLRGAGVDVAARLTPEGPGEASGRRREPAPRDGGCKRGRAGQLQVARGLRGWTLPGRC